MDSAGVAPKILVSSYACSPLHGSEPGMGWNYVSRIAEHFETWVLTDEYFAIQCREYLKLNQLSIPKLHLVGIERPGGRHRVYGYFYLHYLTQNLWQRKAFQVAQRLHAREHFDLIHQLNMIGYREPGYLWQLDNSKPYIWGPIGGHAQIPPSFLPFLGLKELLVYGLRNVLNFIQMRSLVRVRKAIHRANVLFAATADDANSISRIHKKDTILLNETGTAVSRVREPEINPVDNSRPLELIWSGVFLGSKALPLGLHALKRAQQMNPSLRVRLSILGDGPCKASWKRLSSKLGITDLCVWKGNLPHDEALDRFRRADALIFTSLKEASSTVVPEALTYGVPIICHDACGFGYMVTDRCGIKIPMIDPNTSIDGFANAILKLEANRHLIQEMAKSALMRAQELTWENQTQMMLNEYRKLLNRAGSNLLPPKQQN